MDETHIKSEAPGVGWGIPAVNALISYRQPALITAACCANRRRYQDSEPPKWFFTSMTTFLHAALSLPY